MSRPDCAPPAEVVSHSPKMLNLEIEDKINVIFGADDWTVID